MAKRMNKNQVEELQKTARVMYGEDSNITLPTAAMEAFGLTSLDDVDRITNEYEDVADPSLNPEEKYIEDEEKEDLKRIFISVMLGEESKNDSLIRAALEKRNETNFCKRAMGFILRQGLIDEKKRSYAEVGELLGVNPETVRTYDQAIQNRLFDIFAFGLKERDLIRAKKMSLPKSYTEIANMYINDELVRISKSDLTEEQKEKEMARLAEIQAVIENSVEKEIIEAPEVKIEHSDLARSSINLQNRKTTESGEEEPKKIIISAMSENMEKYDSWKRAMATILRHGLIDGKCRPFDEIGKMLGVSGRTAGVYEADIRKRHKIALRNNELRKGKEVALEGSKKRPLPKSYTEIANLYINDEIARISKSDLTEEQKEKEMARLAEIQAVINNSIEKGISFAPETTK